ncbi:hypothetical protein OG754_34835 [Streptomyces decoyicus]|uniref:hypothetical protein n=1 Tax=Streptomyces decoyicus TaxID=249567 RepID=UPI002E3429CF|nr:hypothetical protein [Streptomyces decoyicus]
MEGAAEADQRGQCLVEQRRAAVPPGRKLQRAKRSRAVAHSSDEPLGSPVTTASGGIRSTR